MSRMELLHGDLKDDEEYRRAFAEEDLIHRVAERVYQIRHKLDITQAELADRLGTQQPAVARIEGGFENLTLRSVANLAWALDCRSEDLVKRRKPLVLQEDWNREDENEDAEVHNLFEATVSVSKESASTVEEDDHLMAAGI